MEDSGVFKISENEKELYDELERTQRDLELTKDALQDERQTRRRLERRVTELTSELFVLESENTSLRTRVCAGS